MKAKSSTTNYHIAMAFLIGVALASCGRQGNQAKNNESLSPAPTVPPEEKRRVTHPAGYSIIFPPGMKGRPQSVSSGLSTDALGTLSDTANSAQLSEPTLMVERYSVEHSDYMTDLLARGGVLPGSELAQFQGKPAFYRFEPGFGRKSPRGLKSVHFPYYQETLRFEREGRWFAMSFSMKNVFDDRDPFHPNPLPIIREYLESFKYEPEE